MAQSAQPRKIEVGQGGQQKSDVIDVTAQQQRQPTSAPGAEH